MNLKDWEIIATISEEGNLSRVSKRLYISQPAVTKRVQRMEEELGINILYKTNRGVQLTPQGEYLVNKASDMMQRIEIIENTLQRMNDPLSGTIKISAANFMMRYKLPEILSKFKALYPGIEFEVTTGWSQDMIGKLLDKKVDISFIRGDYPWGKGKHLLFEESVCIASLNEVALEDLPEMNRIDYRTDYKLKELMDTWWMENYNVKPKMNMVVSRTDICIEMVAAGLGYAIVPKFVADRFPELHIIELKDAFGRTVTRPSWMLYRSGAEEIEVMKVFINYIKDMDFN